MAIVTAKQLKQRTGEVLTRVRSGERVVVTYRGKPAAVITPPSTEDTDVSLKLRPFDEAWEDIEQTLKKKAPEFTGWKEAVAWVRNRT